MREFRRRLRGVFATGLLWGALGGVIGVIWGVIGSMTDPATLGEWVLSIGVGLAGFGFLAGSGFAGMLALADGKKSLLQLSPGRAAMWGGLAGFTLPLALVASLSGGALPLLPAIASAAAFGGVTALLGAGTVYVAKRGALFEEPADGQLLPPPTSNTY